MKINYEALAEVLEPYDLVLNDNIIYGFVHDEDCIDRVPFLDLNEVDLSHFVKDVKNNDVERNWIASIKLLIPILHPHHSRIFEEEINKDKLINVFKKYGGWEVENNQVLHIPYNNDIYQRCTYYIDVLIDEYINRHTTTSGADVILSFMHHYEDEFME